MVGTWSFEAPDYRKSFLIGSFLCQSLFLGGVLAIRGCRFSGTLNQESYYFGSALDWALLFLKLHFECWAWEFMVFSFV